MSIKSNFIAVIIAGIFSVLILVSCQSHEQKPDDAFENYKEEKMKPEDSDTISAKIIQVTNKTEVVKKNPSQDEWEKFKIEIEKKILLNGNKITAIQSIPNANSKSLNKVERLAKENSDLRSQMDQYNRDAKAKLEKFKSQMNQEVNDIDMELTDIKSNVKGIPSSDKK